MLAERIKAGCGIQARWKLDPTLWQMLWSLEQSAHTDFDNAGPIGIPYPGLFILSGFRTEEENDRVGGAENSRHLICPSQAVDLRFGSVAGASAPAIWAYFGAKWKLLGGRWGGDFGDENHFDLG